MPPPPQNIGIRQGFLHFIDPVLTEGVADPDLPCLAVAPGLRSEYLVEHLLPLVGLKHLQIIIVQNSACFISTIRGEDEY